jgi:hypothetical protein
MANAHKMYQTDPKNIQKCPKIPNGINFSFFGHSKAFQNIPKFGLLE